MDGVCIRRYFGAIRGKKAHIMVFSIDLLKQMTSRVRWKTGWHLTIEIEEKSFKGGSFCLTLVYLIYEIVSNTYTYIEKCLNIGKERKQAKKASPANISQSYQEDINQSPSYICFFSQNSAYHCGSVMQFLVLPLAQAARELHAKPTTGSLGPSRWV